MTDAEILELTIAACRSAGCTCNPHIIINHIFADVADDGLQLTATLIHHEKDKCEGYRRFVGASGAN